MFFDPRKDGRTLICGGVQKGKISAAESSDDRAGLPMSPKRERIHHEKR
jgi:hypothetical protein